MYSHPLLERHEMRRKYPFPERAARPRREAFPAPREGARRLRTLDEKLDLALELTFPASDAFVVGA